MSWLVIPAVAEGLVALEDAHRLVVAGEIAEVRAVAGLAAAWRVDEDAACAAGERLVRGGADGTPLVGEFLAAEIAPRLGVSGLNDFFRTGSSV